MDTSRQNHIEHCPYGFQVDLPELESNSRPRGRLSHYILYQASFGSHRFKQSARSNSAILYGWACAKDCHVAASGLFPMTRYNGCINYHNAVFFRMNRGQRETLERLLFGYLPSSRFIMHFDSYTVWSLAHWEGGCGMHILIAPFRSSVSHLSIIDYGDRDHMYH